jgi:tetratricopeptide (TPR) repeat protein
MSHIILRLDGSEVFRAEFPAGEYIIGREADVDIYADLPELSRRHARLRITDEDLSIEDLGSSNGTFVDEEPVTGPTSIRGRQSVRLGDVCLEVQGTHSAGGTTFPPRSGQAFVPHELGGGSRYEVGGIVAHGGMGNILDARQNAMRREVAMKVMRGGADATSLQRFINEARITGQLEHPNIVPVHELGVDDNQQVFYTMKFVRGITLAEVIAALAANPMVAAKTYALPALLTIYQKVCDAVAFAHSRGIIHRDLKPENIMLGDFGEVLVMDWGLAKVIGRGSAGDPADTPAGPAIELTGLGSTLTGSVLGTPRYMSPEQARGEVDTLDGRSDIYSLGAILYEMLHLKPVVSGTNPLEIIGKVAQGRLDKIPKTRSPHLPDGRVPQSLVAVHRKALALHPAARYQEVSALQADIAAYQAGFATGAEGASLAKHFSLMLKRHKAVSTAIAASVAILGVVSTIYTVRVVAEGHRASKALSTAESEGRRANEALALATAAGLEAKNALAKAQDEQRRANTERDRAIDALAEAEALRKNAEDAVVKLKGTAPMFLKIAQDYIKAGKAGDAVDALQQAVNIAPQNQEYRRQRANVLQSSRRFKEAISEYRQVIAMGDDPQAKMNLELSEKWLKENGEEEELRPDLEQELIAALAAQGRIVESILLRPEAQADQGMAALPEPAVPAPADPSDPTAGYSDAERGIYQKLGEYTAQEGWNRGRIGSLPGGGFRINLAGLIVGSLAELQGEPVMELDLSSSNFENPSSIARLPLRRLSIQQSRVTSLDALRAVPLVYLNASGLRITDISALSRMPLAELHLDGTMIGSLKPLSRLPLMKLHLSAANVEDIGALKGLKLEELTLNSNDIVSLEPLRNMPLKRLEISNCAKVKDFSPLASLSYLVSLALPIQASKLGFLGQLKSLERVKHPRFSPDGGEMAIADFMELANKSEAAWLVIEPKLKLTDAKDLRMDRVTAEGANDVSLDLRGTGITNLKPLTGLPISRLAIDTPSEALDLSPLRSLPLAHLNLSGAYVPLVRPFLPSGKLASLALPFHAADIHLLAKHPALQHLGYEIQPALNRPSTTVADFFSKRTDDPDWPEPPPAGLVVAHRFDDAAEGAMGWTVTHENVRKSLSETESAMPPDPVGDKKDKLPAVFGWHADPPPLQGLGGGYLSAGKPVNNDSVAYFNAPKTLLGDQSGIYGGSIEFRIRQFNTTRFYGAPDVELRSGNLRLVHTFQGPPTPRWRAISVPLHESAWRINTIDGQVPQARDLERVLAKLESLRIRAEFSNQALESTDLDDVRFWNAEGTQARAGKVVPAWLARDPWRDSCTFTSSDTGAMVPGNLEFSYIGRDVWIDKDGEHEGVALLHPMGVEEPAIINYQVEGPIVENSRVRIVARSSEVHPGVIMKVLQKKKEITSQAVDADWCTVQGTLQESGSRKSEITIEIWAHQWNNELCYIDSIEILPP